MSSYYFDPRHIYSKRPANTKKGQVIQKKPLDTPQYYSRSMIKSFFQFLKNNNSLNPWYSPYLFVPYVYDYHIEEPIDPEDIDFVYNIESIQDDWIIHRTSNLVRLPTLLSGSYLSSFRYNDALTVFVLYRFPESSLLSYLGFALNSDGNLTVPNDYLPITTQTTIQFEMNIDTTISDTATAIISLILLSGSTIRFTGYATIAFKPVNNGKFLNLSVGPSTVNLVYFDAHYQALKDFEPDFNK